MDVSSATPGLDRTSEAGAGGEEQVVATAAEARSSRKCFAKGMGAVAAAEKRSAKTVGGWSRKMRSPATPHEVKPWDQAGSNGRPKCIVGSQPACNEAVGTEVPATKLPERKPSEALSS